MRRREFLSVSALLAASSLGPRPSRASDAAPWSARGSDSAAHIGRAYLAKHEDERDVDVLRAHLGDLVSQSGGDGLAERAGARIREDFATGRTVQVDGWLLSRTEARLCALAALRS